MNRKIVLYIIIGLVIVALLSLALFSGLIQVWKDEVKSIDEKCKVPSGYTEESWREHMGHHPDIYKECLDLG